MVRMVEELHKLQTPFLGTRTRVENGKVRLQRDLPSLSYRGPFPPLI